MKRYVIERLDRGLFNGMFKNIEGANHDLHIDPDGDPAVAAIFNDEDEAEEWFDALGGNDEPAGDITYRIVEHRPA